MAKLEISVKDVGMVKDFVVLAASYTDELPDKLVESLNNFANCATFEVGQDELIKMGIDPSKVRIECDGVEIKKVVSFNKTLKRVTCLFEKDDQLHVVNGEIVDIYKWPKSLDVIVDGKKLESLGW